MTPPNRFWPFYDDEVEIYDNLSWDMPGKTRHPRTPEKDRPTGPSL
jgi:hypothetical protein